MPFNSSYLSIAIVTVGGCVAYSPITASGILIGDVDASYNVSTSGNNLRQESDTDKIVYDLSAATKTRNGFNIPVYIYSSTKAEAVDLSLDYDQTKATINAVSLAKANQTELVYNDFNKDVLLVAAVLDTTSTSDQLLNIEIATSQTLDENLFKNYRSQINGNEVTTSFRTETTTEISAQNQSEVKVYPNPSNGYFTLENATGYTDYVVTDLVGKIVFAGKTGDKITLIDLSAQPSGIYTLIANHSKFIKLINY